MDFRTRIKMSVNKLFLGKGKTIFDCADHVNRSTNYLYRIANINEDVPCPIEIAIPIMKFKKNFELLQAICWECGFVAYKIPTSKMSIKDERQMAADYQNTTAATVQALLAYLDEPTAENYLLIGDYLQNVIKESAGVKKYIEKKQTRQEELF